MYGFIATKLASMGQDSRNKFVGAVLGLFVFGLTLFPAPASATALIDQQVGSPTMLGVNNTWIWRYVTDLLPTGEVGTIRFWSVCNNATCDTTPSCLWAAEGLAYGNTKYVSDSVQLPTQAEGADWVDFDFSDYPFDLAGSRYFFLSHYCPSSPSLAELTSPSNANLGYISNYQNGWNFSTGSDTRDPLTLITDTTPPDPRPSPTTEIYSPADSTAAGFEVWNAPFYFRAKSNIDSDTYPGEFVFFDFVIFDDVASTVFETDLLPFKASNIYYENDYAIMWPSGYVFTDPGDYTIQARSRVLTGDWGEWSTAVSFTVEDDSEDNGVLGYAAAYNSQGNGGEGICADYEPWEVPGGDFDLLGLIGSFIPSLINSFKQFIGLDVCYSIQPLFDLKTTLLQHAPFKQAIWTVTSLKNAINETEASDSTIEFDMSGLFGGDSGGDLVVWDFDAVYDFLGGYEFWGVYMIPIIMASTTFGLGWYFYNEALWFFRKREE